MDLLLIRSDLRERIPSNCVYTTQHPHPSLAQTEAPPSTTGLGLCNSGLLVAHPSSAIYDLVLQRINTPAAVEGYAFPDQDLLSDLFQGRWVALPYVYNALKTLRRKGVHDAIWRDEGVKNVHYILMPKPWMEDDPAALGRKGGEEEEGDGDGKMGEAGEQKEKERDETHEWWWEVNRDRLRQEAVRGIADGF